MLLGVPLVWRVCIGAILFLVLTAFAVTLPEIRIAEKTGTAPRQIAWPEILERRVNLDRRYVRITDILTGTVSREVLEDRFTRREGETTNTYEVLYDPATRRGILVGHYGGNEHPRSGPPVRATLVGMIFPMSDGTRGAVPSGRNVDAHYQFVQDRHPVSVRTYRMVFGGQLAAAALLLAAGVGALVRARRRGGPAAV